MVALHLEWFRAFIGKSSLRGRVHRMSVTKGGEVSIVVRFGMDEPRARHLNQGALLDCVPHTAGKAAVAIHAADKKKRKPSAAAIATLQGVGSILDIVGTTADDLVRRANDLRPEMPPSRTVKEWEDQ